MLQWLRDLILTFLGLQHLQAKLAELRKAIKEKDDAVMAQREAITMLDNAIARISRDGLPPNVLTTSSAQIIEMRTRIQYLERGERFLPEPE